MKLNKHILILPILIASCSNSSPFTEQEEHIMLSICDCMKEPAEEVANFTSISLKIDDDSTFANTLSEEQYELYTHEMVTFGQMLEDGIEENMECVEDREDMDALVDFFNRLDSEQLQNAYYEELRRMDCKAVADFGEVQYRIHQRNLQRFNQQ